MLAQVLKKTTVEDVYVSQDGRETPVRNMVGLHLVNAFGKAVLDENEPVKKALKEEIMKRLKDNRCDE